MKPVYFNCKSVPRQRKGERCSSSDLLSWLALVVFPSPFFQLHSISYETISSRLPAQLVAHVMFFPRFSHIFFYFRFYSGCDASLSACLPSFYLSTSSPADHSFHCVCPPLRYLTCLFALSPSFSVSQAPCENLRTPSTYPGNMLPHHPGQANFEDFTCWADPGEASKCVLCNQSQPYNRNYPTRGVWGTDTKSNRGTFYVETE